MYRHSALLRLLLTVCAAGLSGCVTSPYYTPARSSVYYVQDPWFYRNGYRYCHDVWYGCSRPYYGNSYYGGYPPPPAPPPPPAKPPPRPKPPPDDEPVYAPKPPRLIRLGHSEPAPGRVIAPAPAKPPVTVRAPAKPLIKAPRVSLPQQAPARAAAPPVSQERSRTADRPQSAARPRLPRERRER